MKLLSIAIPSYNAERFLEECVTSLLGYEDVELIIINDGSKDRTLEIANSFKEKYPDYIKVIDKENGGHGSGLNEASKIAEGLYFKCCDSDDSLSREGLLYLLNKIKEFQKAGTEPDLFFADYIAVYSNHNKETVCGLKKYFPIDKVIGYEGIKSLGQFEYMMIHMTFVKTKILQDNHLHLVEKTFYEDNQFVYFILGHSNTICYLDKPIYRYSLGDSGQSVSVPNMIKNYLHDLRAFTASFKCFTWADYSSWSKKKRKFVKYDLTQKYILAYAYAFLAYGKERRAAFNDMKKSCKEFDKTLYKKMRHSLNPTICTFVPVFIRPPLVRFGTWLISKLKGWNY